ncbi:MAG: sugar ABC transporter permease [Polyangiaceae bacterium]
MRAPPGRKGRAIRSWALLAPTIGTLAIFVIYPLGRAVYESLYAWDMLYPRRPVGLENYAALAKSGALGQIALRTLAFAGIVVTLSTALGLGLALLLNRPGRIYGFVRGAVFSAYVVSWVAVALLWMWILDDRAGAATAIVSALHLPAPRWLGDPAVAPISLALVTVWKVTGYAMVVFLAALQGIPRSLHEAAALDGAGPLRRFVHVTWPALRPTTAFVVTTSLIASFQAFDVIRVMTQGGPVKSTTLFVYAIYEEVFVNLRVGRASALVVVFFVGIGALTWLNAWVLRRSAKGAS